MSHAVSPGVFREYDIRGIADRDLTDAAVDRIAGALAKWFVDHGKKHIAVGRDCRVSSPRIHKVLVDRFLKSGLQVLDIGVGPTPLLYFAVQFKEQHGGVMITGSHNPPEHNGFKIAVDRGTIYGDQIQEIGRLALAGTMVEGRGERREEDVRDAYVAKVIESVAGNAEQLRGFRVGIDCGNGAAAGLATKLYRAMGCEVTALFDELDGTFPHHHPDPTMPENLEDLTTLVREQKLRFGIAFDGDADRIGVVDGSGRALFGDELLAVFARDLLTRQPGAKIVSEVKASQRLFRDIEAHGGVPILWKTGHSLIKAKMAEEGAILAGEMSGHMFFKDRWYGFDDALYAGARLIEIVARTHKSPAAHVADWPSAFTTPEIRVDCPDEKKFAAVAKATHEFRAMGLTVNGIDGARIEFADGWGLVRASNTQPVLVYRFEAQTQQRLDEIRALIEGVVARCLGAA